MKSAFIYILRLAGFLVAVSPASSHAERNVEKSIDGGATMVCTDYQAGVYRPFTVVRKVKLATAYFVNPALPDKLEIVNAYSIGDIVRDRKTDELWNLLTVGKIKVPAMVYGERNAFALVPWKDYSTTPVCNRPIKYVLSSANEELRDVSEKVRYASLERNLGAIDFSSRQAFKATIEKLGYDKLDKLIVFTESLLSGVPSKQQYVSWDPMEAINLVVK